MKVMITGANGLCGRALAPILAEYYDYEVIGTDIKNPDNGFPFVNCDIRDAEDVERAIGGKDLDAIIHLGALLPGLGSPDMSIDINIKGTCNILESARKNGVGKVVFTSSVWAASRGPTAAYQPTDENIPCVHEDMYDITKRMGEQFCDYYYRHHGLSAIAFRFCGYEPIEGFSSAGDILWDEIDIKALAARYLGMGSKLTNAWDLTQAFRLAIESKDVQHGLFLIGVGSPFASEEAKDLRNAPLSVLEKHYPGVSDFLNEIGQDVPAITFWHNTQKAEKHLGFSPKLSLNDIMRQYYENKGK